LQVEETEDAVLPANCVLLQSRVSDDPPTEFRPRLLGSDFLEVASPDDRLCRRHRLTQKIALWNARLSTQASFARKLTHIISLKDKCAMQMIWVFFQLLNTLWCMVKM
jgi:hypothetical protein